MVNCRLSWLVFYSQGDLAARVIASAELRCAIHNEASFVASVIPLNDDASNEFHLSDANLNLVAAEFMWRLHSCVVTGELVLGGQRLERWIGPMARYMELQRADGWHCVITGSLHLPGSVVHADATEVRMLCGAFEHVAALRTRYPSEGAMDVCREDGIPYVVGGADADQIFDFFFTDRLDSSMPLTLRVGDLQGNSDIVGMLIQRHNTASNDIVLDLQIRFMDPLPQLAEYDENKSGSVFRFTNGAGATLIVEPVGNGLRAARNVEL